MLQDLDSNHLPILVSVPLSPVFRPNERPPSFNFQKARWDDFDSHCPSAEEYSSRTFSFSKHVSSLKAKFFPRLKAVRCISASSRGPSKESLSLLYKSFLRPRLTYALPGWFSFFSAINFTKLERLHRAASRAITGCLSSSPIPLLLTEASLPPLRVTHSFILLAGSSSPNLLSYFRFGQTRSETKTLQIVLESSCVHSPAHASFYLF